MSTKAAADPTNPAYLHFYKPDLATSYDHPRMPDKTVAAACAKQDPLVMTSEKTFSYGTEWGAVIWSWLNGLGFSSILVPGQPAYCEAIGDAEYSLFTAANTNDWRMVTVRKPTSGERQATFFDVETLRSSNTLLMKSPRVGFFTTPAFLSQWSTNASNSARAAVNQTLITALGGQVDGSDRLAQTHPTAVDPQHAADPACYSCHETLDPLRQFFRQSFSRTYSAQDDASQLQIPATFSFRGQLVAGTGNGVEDLANAQADGQNTLASRAAVVPPDSDARGLDATLYVVQPDPFYVANVENLCALVAGQVVDGSNAFVTSTDPDAAVAKLVAELMGLDPQAAAIPAALLRAHYDDARGAGQSVAVALQSTFVAACTSAMVTSIGQ